MNKQDVKPIDKPYIEGVDNPDDYLHWGSFGERHPVGTPRTALCGFKGRVTSIDNLKRLPQCPTCQMKRGK